MNIRNAFVINNNDTAGVDSDIARAFDPAATDAIDKRLLKVDTLSRIIKQMTDWKMNISSIVTAANRIFAPEGYTQYAIDVAEWEELKGMRDQMLQFNIETSHIDRIIANLFKVVILASLQRDASLTPA